MNYRPDIDGLRAISVLAVIAAHIGIHAVPGGFLGVDVFFVISGYLISGLVFTEITRDQFSLRTFYERRIRRIAPALAAMLLVVSIVACRYLLPQEMEDFGKSLLATILGGSNFFFWSKAGYFAPLAAAQPLLHTWSLAVEEQFYLFWPLLLFITYRYRRSSLNAVTWVLLVVSFAICATQDLFAPNARFYLLPSREWELLSGALISLNILPKMHSALLRQTAACVGIALIVGSFALVRQNATHLGLLSAFPCFGAVLLISAGEQGSTLPGRFLATKPVVFVGLISYSLYLWHWPIIVLHRLGMAEGLARFPHLDKLVVLAMSFVLAVLSWKFVERPFRTRKTRPAVLFRTVTATFGVFAVWGLTSVASHGLTGRFSADTVRLASFLYYNQASVSREGTCFITDRYSYANFDRAACLHGNERRRNMLLLGDSHAAHLWYGLSRAFPDRNILQATAAGCAPSPGPRGDAGYDCKALTGFLAGYLPLHHMDTLLLEAAWGDWDLNSLPALLDRAKAWADHVVLFGPMVRYDSPLPRLLAVAAIDHDAYYPVRHRLADLPTVDDAMAAIAREKGVTYVSFFKLLCPTASCETLTPEGIPMLYDYGHLTREGSLYVAEFMRARNALP